ncbi:PREDICTED: oviduct-specific glycoprotein-like isoform X2 [Priapulus caudatus]|nr:PREDICTED: oviduct-specific glycoprotein-like isoform X2 [Priapulus caudatus]XP_014681210.1 PREDICTED: oviduct-specific glycoprotein-like isoform X2 [Priapulus caudatus]XP_014681211.1 PREDICTED: oviduct-specific glycoprotein-like isoform X2 [Priapulus caudatus]
MHRRITWTLMAILVWLSGTVNSRMLVCYYTNWSQYREGDGHFTPADIDPDLCTHVMYMVAKLNRVEDLTGEKYIIDAVEWNDYGGDTVTGRGYSSVIRLKRFNPSLKVILSVGGYSMGPKPFSDLAMNRSKWADFTKQAIGLLRRFHFDGLDINWIYPGDESRQGRPEDKQRFPDLLQTLREGFNEDSWQRNADRLLLSASVAPNEKNMNRSYEVGRMSPWLDFVNLLTYDYHGAWENTTGHNSPLGSTPLTDDSNNVRTSLKRWLSQDGALPEQVVLGVPMYGRCFMLSEPSMTHLGAPTSSPCPAGMYTGEPGFLSYYEICDILFYGDYRQHYDTQERVAYAEDGVRWISYDTVDSLMEKVAFARTECLAGVGAYALDLDDFANSKCATGNYPLLTAIQRAVHETVPGDNCSTATVEVPTRDEVVIRRGSFLRQLGADLPVNSDRNDDVSVNMYGLQSDAAQVRSAQSTIFPRLIHPTTRRPIMYRPVETRPVPVRTFTVTETIPTGPATVTARASTSIPHVATSPEMHVNRYVSPSITSSFVISSAMLPSQVATTTLYRPMREREQQQTPRGHEGKPTQTDEGPNDQLAAIRYPEYITSATTELGKDTRTRESPSQEKRTVTSTVSKVQTRVYSLARENEGSEHQPAIQITPPTLPANAFKTERLPLPTTRNVFVPLFAAGSRSIVIERTHVASTEQPASLRSVSTRTATTARTRASSSTQHVAASPRLPPSTASPSPRLPPSTASPSPTVKVLRPGVVILQDRPQTTTATVSTTPVTTVGTVSVTSDERPRGSGNPILEAGSVKKYTVLPPVHTGTDQEGPNEVSAFSSRHNSASCHVAQLTGVIVFVAFVLSSV